jgi:hypothetical protein
MYRRENVGTNIKFLVRLGKSGSEIRGILVQVYVDNAMKKTEVYKWVRGNPIASCLNTNTAYYEIRFKSPSISVEGIVTSKK